MWISFLSLGAIVRNNSVDFIDGTIVVGKVGYDSILGLLRVSAAGQRKPDAFVTDVLTYHAAIEAEMDQFLSNALPRPEKLAAGGLGFQHKIAIVGASWKGEADKGNKLCNALVRFNDLRNSVAHNDASETMQKHLSRLVAAVSAFDPNVSKLADVRVLAITICAFMGDVLLGRQYTSEGWVDEEDEDEIEFDEWAKVVGPEL